ncbi:hypothetical protein EOPP23_18020 [Endozoicomonas sp. OPT23]|uniref:MucB/RseB C-terminal domain-containing protein n=1 Tax=Endozoicomonas sp. OPT23 TaxID=2072845 RepID=UPI00129B2398|nr:MucB/RseB C-terminal domain-containing protein [Endozoicomonas sp. OPT23]MRI34878.1 hypothetical protein [Endozoicomonas sp. OPT23]
MKGIPKAGRTLASIFFSFFLVAGQASATSQADTPEQWLEAMSDATRNLTYRGHFVYQQGANLETLNIIHTRETEKDSQRELERIRYQDGLPREMIRRGKEIVFATAGREPTRFEHESLMPMVGRFTGKEFRKFYDLKPASLDRIANREAVQLLVIPTDRHRHGYQLWLDRRTGLMLKSVMVDSDGRIMERIQFTDLEFPEKLSETELTQMKAVKAASVNEKLVKLTDEDNRKPAGWSWKSGWIPDGFSLRSQSRRKSPVSDQTVDAVNYSDGLASFSIFVEPDETRVLSQATEQIGSMAAVSKVFRSDNSFFHVTVVGEIPLGTAERIAVSVRPEEQKQTQATK